MRREAVHGLSKREIFGKAMALGTGGRLFERGNAVSEDGFLGSVDRFCEIADALRYSRRVLDVGCAGGVLLSLLAALGHECYGIDVNDMSGDAGVFRAAAIDFRVCNVEVDPIPHPDDFFDAVVCCQTLEHFTHSHLGAVREMRRVLRPGGIVEIDVPNAVCFRNRSRMLRGKHITWDYRTHYLHAKPVLYKGLSFYPDRHNRDFTRDDLVALLEAADFRVVDVRFLKSRRHRSGLRAFLSVGSAIRDVVPSLRKSIIAFGEKAGGGP